ncbi:MAG: acyltransferase family protein [Desulfobacterales bacterium]|jgi:acyltransferase
MRIAWIDNVKAIGILLVVYGHTAGFGFLLEKFAYSFHMPLFFFVSGYLLKPKYLYESFNSYFAKHIKSLVIPYASFWLISYACWLPTQALRSRAQQYAELPFWDPVLGLIYGVYTKLYVNQVLWFFPCLFCTVLLFYFISKIKNDQLILITLIFLGVIGPYINEQISFRLPWNVELSFVAVVFFSLGHYFCRFQFLRMVSRIKFKIFICAALTGILLIIVSINGKVNMNRMIFGNLALFYLGAFCGISLTIILSHMIPKNFCTEWLSFNTIVIFPMHVIFFNIFSGIGVIFFNLDHSFKNSSLFSVVYIIGAILTSIPVVYIIRRYFPWMIGQKYRKNRTIIAQTARMRKDSQI